MQPIVFALLFLFSILESPIHKPFQILILLRSIYTVDVASLRICNVSRQMGYLILLFLTFIIFFSAHNSKISLLPYVSSLATISK